MRLADHRPLRPARLRRPARAGFTLIELLVTIGIMIFVLGASVVAFNTMFKTTGVDAAARTLRAAIEGARMRAIQQRRPIRFEARTLVGSTTCQWQVTPNAGDQAQEWKDLPEFVAVDTNAGTSGHGDDGRGGDYRPTTADKTRSETHTFADATTTTVKFSAVDRISVTLDAQGSVKRWALYQRYEHSSKGEFYHEWASDDGPAEPFALRLTNLREVHGTQRLRHWLVVIPIAGGLQPHDSEGETM